MAIKTDILLLIELYILIYTVKSCDVICFTDYEKLLNCSCSGQEPSETLLLRVQCRLYDLTLNESCLVSNQRPYCLLYPDILKEIADIETVCSAIALRARDHTLITKELSNWQLRFAVRPWPPSNISVKMTKMSYNITWINNNTLDCLTFIVRIKTPKSTQKTAIIMESTQSFVQLEQARLLPGVCYRVDIKAKLCPGLRIEGNWSEWSVPALLTTATVKQLPGTKHYYWLITLPILIFLSLGFPKAVLWHKKFKVITYIPKPGEFFKPLYNSYQGNFKAWVKPMFAEQTFHVHTGADIKLDHWNQSLSSPDSNLVHSPIRNVSPVSSSTFNIASHCSVTSSYLHGAKIDVCELDRHPQRPSLNLSTLNVLQDLDEEELSRNDYPLMDLDTIDSGFVECSSPPVTKQIFCQTNLGPTEPQCDLHHSNYVKQWTMSEAVDNCLQQNTCKDMEL